MRGRKVIGLEEGTQDPFGLSLSKPSPFIRRWKKGKKALRQAQGERRF
jgi:hypothetical protein